MPIYSEVLGSGTPVLLIHGRTIDHRMMLPLDPLFDADAHEWERHHIDLPGHGRSPRLPSMSSTSVAEAVSDYVRDRFGDRAFGLVGASFGGWVARSIHVRYGPRVLGSALLAPAVREPSTRTVYEGGPVERDGFDRELADDQQGVLEDFRGVSPLHTRESFGRFVDHVYPGLSVHDRGAADELMDDYHLEPYPELDAPGLLGGVNLVITGRQDGVVGWRDQWDLVDLYDNLTFAAVEAAGHNVHLDQPAVTDALLHRWLAGMARRTC